MENGLFNIRVYGLFIRDQKILVTDELRFGMEMTKFPGGGLDYGEGTIDCLKRECKEELNYEIHVLNHYYTTDFFQKSIFDNKQLISIYYSISIPEINSLKMTAKKIDFQERKEGTQTFRFIDINQDIIDELTFPVDKVVARMLIDKLIK